MTESECHSFVCGPEDAGERLDRVLARRFAEHSRSFLQKLVRDGRVICGGTAITQPRFAMSEGMECSLEIPAIAASRPSSAPFDFPVLYEDDSLLVIDKPAGVVVHPGAGNPENTVLNALYGRYPGFGEAFGKENDRPGIVHRLDKDTSGCLVIAKTPAAHFHLTAAFAAHEVRKTYLAVLAGVPVRRSETLRTLIGRHPVNRQKMAVVSRNGKEAETTYVVLGDGVFENRRYALAAVRIGTGRTHQIRVHMAFRRTPVVGDALYGGDRSFPAARQLLHAWKLEFNHPLTGEAMSFHAPPPPDMREFFDGIDLGKIQWPKS